MESVGSDPCGSAGGGLGLTSLLYANDTLGAYPNSYYAAMADIPAKRDRLDGARRADVCIIGAGYTGLSAALTLAQAGVDVVVLDAHRVGWGASGRNGGQLGTGQRAEQPELEEMFGLNRAKALWDIAEEATRYAKELIAVHAIECHLKPGVVHTNHKARYDREAEELVEHMARVYGHEMTYLPPDACRALVKSPRYSAGILDKVAAHVDPLRFALGLAGAAEAAGAVIHEESEVTAIERNSPVKVKTAHGSVTADHVILAGNGYLEGLAGEVTARVMPINNYIIATEPIDPALVLAEDVAVADSKFVVNYFRLSDDKRLLFGGGESYGYRFPADIKAFVRKKMIEIFPQTGDLRIDYGWGGTLAITLSRLPHLRAITPQIWSASGYSGHGVAMAVMSGRMVGDAILGQSARFDEMARLPHQNFPGGHKMRHPLLVLAMLWYGMRDRL